MSEYLMNVSFAVAFLGMIGGVFGAVAAGSYWAEGGSLARALVTGVPCLLLVTLAFPYLVTFG